VPLNAPFLLEERKRAQCLEKRGWEAEIVGKANPYYLKPTVVKGRTNDTQTDHLRRLVRDWALNSVYLKGATPPREEAWKKASPGQRPTKERRKTERSGGAPEIRPRRGPGKGGGKTGLPESAGYSSSRRGMEEGGERGTRPALMRGARTQTMRIASTNNKKQ